MYDIANEEAANDELAYQNEFLSEFIGELCMWEEYDDNRQLQELSNDFANACMENEVEPPLAVKLFKSFWTCGLRRAAWEIEYKGNELKVKADKWDALGEKIGKYYDPENEDGEHLLDIGVDAATAFNYL